MWTAASLFAFAVAFQAFLASVNGGGSGLPVDKVYGVNLGSWLLLEPWMLPNEWVEMGGETCFMAGRGTCGDCAASEFDLVKKIGQSKADEVFQKHWETWFTGNDVQNIRHAGLNTVRIPIGYWIIEDLVDRETEFYPRGGIKQLKRGLEQLKSAGIHVLLDFHALPGVSSKSQMFAGHCTADVQFYTPSNYFRALQWAAVTTFLSHVDPAFNTVFGIEAINEPIMDPSMTPGYGDYLTDFALIVRAVELTLGIICPGVDYLSLLKFGGSLTGGGSPDNATDIPTIPHLASNLGGRIGEVLTSIIPIISNVARELGVDNPLSNDSPARREEVLKRGLFNGANRQCLHTTFMDVLWQGVRGFNPAKAAVGPAMFDDHLYFSFGGVAQPNAESYLETICTIPKVKNDTDLGNLPMVFGEWALSTNFNATDEFLDQWADAQKLRYSESSGWIFWSFKIEDGNPNQREWDYFAALGAGHFTRDPAAFNDRHVCDRYRM